MTILADRQIRELINDGVVGNIGNIDKQLQPASLDIRLGNEFSQFKTGSEIISAETNISEEMLDINIPDGEEMCFKPGQFYLASTKELFNIPNDILGRLTGRSSIGRLGITVHQTAGLFDPGFRERGVFEIKNVSNRTVSLTPGTRIAQMTFEKLDRPAVNPYNSEDNKYQGQDGAIASRIHQDE